MFSQTMSSACLAVFLSVVVAVQSFVIPNYGANYINNNAFPQNGFGQMPSFPNFPSYNMNWDPASSYYPGLGVPVITTNTSSQGPNGAGTFVVSSANASGQHGVSVGGAAQSSGSYTPGSGAVSSGSTSTWSNNGRAGTFPSQYPVGYMGFNNGQYPTSYNYPGVANGIGFQQLQQQPTAYAWLPVNV